MISFPPAFPVFQCNKENEETSQSCETTIKKLLAQDFPPWGTLSAQYRAAAKACDSLGNYPKVIEFLIHSALCELRMTRYLDATNVFYTVRRTLKQLPENSLNSFQRIQLISLLSTQLALLLPANITESLCPLLEMLALLHEAFKDHKGAAIYFERLAEYYLRQENRQRSGQHFYTAGVQMSQSALDQRAYEKTIDLFTRSASILAIDKDWKQCRQAMKQVVKQYEALNASFESAVCWEAIANSYCFDAPAKVMKYLQRALDIYVPLGEKRHEADCLKKLAECLSRQGKYLPSDNTFCRAFDLYKELQELHEMGECLQQLEKCRHTQKMYLQTATAWYNTAAHYIALDQLSNAVECLSKAEAHYRYLFPDYMKVAVECLELAARLCSRNNDFLKAGQYLHRAAKTEFEHGDSLQAASYFSAAGEQFAKGKRPDLLITYLKTAGELFAAAEMYLFAAQAFERAASFCQKTPSTLGQLAYFFYFAGEWFFKGSHYSNAARCYDAVVQTRNLATKNIYILSYNTADAKAKLCREKLKPTEPWNQEIKTWLEHCASAEKIEPKAVQQLVETLEERKAWPEILKFLKEMPLPAFSKEQCTKLLLNFHTDKMPREIDQHPLFERIKEVATLLLSRITALRRT